MAPVPGRTAAPATAGGPFAAPPLRIGVRGWAPPGPEPWDTVANYVTAVRTVASIALAVLAIVEHSWLMLGCAYAVYWLGDTLDGYAARRLGQETRRGGVADIVCDRLCTGSCAAALVVLAPWTWPAVAVFLVQFAVVDLWLSLAFLRWPVLSVNYFWLVDRPLYLWNWSPPAKAVNTTGLIVVLVATGSAAAGVLVAVAGLAVKVASASRMRRLLIERDRPATS